MTREYQFGFVFEVNREFIRQEPDVSARFIAISKDRIARQKYAISPRGATYRLISPPDEWSQTDQWRFGWERDMTAFMTHRTGRYVRPDRVRIIDENGPTFTTLTVKVKQGRAILPKGQTVETESKYVDFPVLV